MNKLLKYIFTSSLLSFLFLWTLPDAVFAAADFSSSFRSTYQVSLDSQTTATHQIALTNEKPNVYASEYSVSIGGTNVNNIIAFDNQGTLPSSINRTQNSTTIVVDLESRAVVGQGKTRNFTLQYQNSDIANNVGKVLEVNIPRIANASEFSSYEISLVVPNEFGPPSSIVPAPLELRETTEHRLVKLTKSQITSGITAVFGTSQTFITKLNYFLENDSSVAVEQAIALIPDTAHQRVSYRSIEPPPQAIERDDDGNWLAIYSLKGHEKLEITTQAEVELYLNPFDKTQDQTQPNVSELTIDPKQYLQELEFWPVADPEIAELASELKTPRAIYDYVVDHLAYDYSKVQTSGRRLGAKAALLNPDQAICTEFVDLFISLARAAGIPAREHNGFAYTQNPALRPLSLSKDVLHAWPEYWNADQERWIQIDPTWADTTGGIDYFTKMDLNHLTFAIHGLSSTSPLPAGFYKTSADQGKTVSVEPASFTIEPTPSYLVDLFIPPRLPTYKNSTVKITIRNLEGQAHYHLPVSVSTPYNIINDVPTEIPWLLPWQEEQFELILRPRSLWKKSQDELIISIGDKSNVYETLATPLLSKPQAIIVALSLGGLASVVVAFLSRRLYLRRQAKKCALRREIEASPGAG